MTDVSLTCGSATAPDSVTAEGRVIQILLYPLSLSIAPHHHQFDEQVMNDKAVETPA
jgi:hypothetical protein